MYTMWGERQRAPIITLPFFPNSSVSSDAQVHLPLWAVILVAFGLTKVMTEVCILHAVNLTDQASTLWM